MKIKVVNKNLIYKKLYKVGSIADLPPRVALRAIENENGIPVKDDKSKHSKSERQLDTSKNRKRTYRRRKRKSKVSTKSKNIFGL